MKPKKHKLFISALALTGMTLPASADTIVWDGSTSTDFEESTNWVGDAAPVNDTATDVAQLTGGTVDLSISRSVGGLDLNSATTLTGSGTSLTVGGSGTTGSADLTIGGSARVILTGTDTALNYTGNINIGSGAVLEAERNALKLDTVTHGLTTITLDGGEISQSGNHLEMTGRNIVLGAGGGTLRHVNNRNIFGFDAGNNISGAGQLTLIGANTTVGRVQLTSTNTYTGGTRIEQGAQAWLYNNDSLGDASGGITMTTGGTLFMANGVTLTQSIALEGEGRINLSNKTFTYNGGADAITGTGSLEFTGTGTAKFKGTSANTYSGGTTLDGGSQVWLSTGALGTGDITLKNDSYLKNDNNNVTIANNITVDATGGGIESGWSNRRVTLQGVVSGDGKLTIRNDSSRVEIQNGSNSYTGGTEILGLVQADSGALGTGDITLNALDDTRGQLKNDGGESVFANNLIISDEAFGGRLMAGWTSNLEIQGTVTGAGTLTITEDSGTVVLSNAANNFSGNIVLEGASSKLTLGGGTFSGDISGDAASTLAFSGDVTLTGNNALTQATTVAAGSTLIINGSSSSSLITVDSGATLGGSGTVGATVVNGTLAVGNSPGTMTFTDAVTLAGTTIMEIDGNAGAGVTGGHDLVNLTGVGAAGVLTYGGVLTLDIGAVLAAGVYSWDLFDFDSETGTFTSVDLADQYSGSLVDGGGGVWGLASGNNTWQFTESTGVLDLTVVPEPSTALLSALGVLALLRRRRA